MDRRGAWIWIALVVFVVGAAAINLALRPDDQEPQTVEPAAREPSEPAAEPAPREEPAAAVERETEEAPAGGCDHPLIPSEPGDWRRYRWQQSGLDRTAELRIEARRARALESGEREISWRVRVTASDDGSELASSTVTTRCEPGVDAEEPWFGIIDLSVGRSLLRVPGRWRWPRELRAGLTLEGTATFRPAEDERDAVTTAHAIARATRRHTVGARESVEVPAGTFDAWRIEYTEERELGEHGESGHGTQWIAPEAGLVRSRAENSQGVIETIELVALGRRE